MDTVWVIERRLKQSFGDVVNHCWGMYECYPTKQAADFHLERISSHVHDFRIAEFVRKETK